MRYQGYEPFGTKCPSIPPSLCYSYLTVSNVNLMLPDSRGQCHKTSTTRLASMTRLTRSQIGSAPTRPRSATLTLSLPIPPTPAISARNPAPGCQTSRRHVTLNRSTGEGIRDRKDSRRTWDYQSRPWIVSHCCPDLRRRTDHPCRSHHDPDQEIASCRNCPGCIPIALVDPVPIVMQCCHLLRSVRNKNTVVRDVMFRIFLV